LLRQAQWVLFLEIYYLSLNSFLLNYTDVIYWLGLQQGYSQPTGDRNALVRAYAGDVSS